MRFLSWLVTTAVAVAAATLLIDGIYLSGPVHGQEEIKHKLVPLLLVALILGVVTSFVKPVLTILSIPFIVVTLGLFLLVINAALLKLTSWLADQLDIGFHVEGFWPAVGGAIVITVVTWIVDSLIGDSR
jgi:putative membrane protein